MRFLLPAIVASAFVGMLMRYESFNTTLMLLGSVPLLTITMFGKLKQGSIPVLNAVAVLLTVVSVGLGLLSVVFQKSKI